MKNESKYKHGTINIVNNQYFFRPDRSIKNESTFLLDFETKAIYMLRDMTLFKGHPSYKKIEKVLQSRYIGSIIANHVCAKGLSTHDVPTLIQHKLLKAGDKKDVGCGLPRRVLWLERPTLLGHHI